MLRVAFTIYGQKDHLNPFDHLVCFFKCPFILFQTIWTPFPAILYINLHLLAGFEEGYFSNLTYFTIKHTLFKLL